MSNKDHKVEVGSIAEALARPLTDRELDVVAGGVPNLTYPPVTPTQPDPHAH